MQTQYSTDELVHLITTNNLTGVYARLVAEGRVSAAMLPNVDAISYAIQEQSGRLSPEAFLTWLEQLLDVPVDQTGLYARELTAIRQTTGKTPARLLTDQIRQTMPQNTVTSFLGDGKRRPYVAWILIGLALCIAGVFLLVGCFLDAIPANIICGPILPPLAKAVAMDPVHFAMIGIVSLAFGLVTPPYGLCLMIACYVAGMRIRDAIKDTMIMLIPMFLVRLLVIIWPKVSLFIPSLISPEFLK